MAWATPKAIRVTFTRFIHKAISEFSYLLSTATVCMVRYGSSKNSQRASF